MCKCQDKTIESYNNKTQLYTTNCRYHQLKDRVKLEDIKNGPMLSKCIQEIGCQLFEKIGLDLCKRLCQITKQGICHVRYFNQAMSRKNPNFKPLPTALDKRDNNTDSESKINDNKSKKRKRQDYQLRNNSNVKLNQGLKNEVSEESTDESSNDDDNDPKPVRKSTRSIKPRNCFEPDDWRFNKGSRLAKKIKQRQQREPDDCDSSLNSGSDDDVNVDVDTDINTNDDDGYDDIDDTTSLAERLANMSRNRRGSNKDSAKAKAKSRYPTNKALDNPIKRQINLNYAKATVHAAWHNPGSCVIYLDGAQACTSRILIEQGLPSAVKMIVPNKPDYLALKQTCLDSGVLSRVTVKDQWLGETLNELDSQSRLASIWMDYTGTLYGNKQDYGNTSPCDDIRRVISSGVLYTGSVFAITLCRRMTKSRGDCRQDAVLFIEREARSAGYRFHTEEIKDYGTMFYLRYLVEKVDNKIVNDNKIINDNKVVNDKVDNKSTSGSGSNTSNDNTLTGDEGTTTQINNSGVINLVSSLDYKNPKIVGELVSLVDMLKVCINSLTSSVK